MPYWLGLIIITILTFIDAKELKWFTSYLRALLPLFLLLGLARRWRKSPPTPRTLVLLFLAGSSFLILGTAMGPGRYGNLFYFNSFQPTVWNVFAEWVPGYSNMRKLSRFVFPGQMLLGALVFSVLLSGLSHPSPIIRKAIALLTVCLVIVQVLEVKAYPTRTTSIHPDTIQLPQAFTADIQSIQGTILALPATPFQRNPQHMLKWAPYKRVNLMNGYSGQSNPTFDHIMDLERVHGSASEEQVTAARQAGADYLFVDSRHIPPENIEWLHTICTVMAKADGYWLFAWP